MDKETKEHESPQQASLISRILRIVLPLALGVVIIYFLFRDIDLQQMWVELKDANWFILLFSLIFGWLGHTIRGYRWNLFLRSLGYSPKVAHLNYAIYGGYAINFVLPRAGEIWRCGILVKDQNIPFSRLFGTMLLDRVFDTITVILITLVAFLFNMQFFLTQLQENEKALTAVSDVISSPYLYIIIFFSIASIYIIFRFFSELSIVKKIKSFTIDIVADMQAIWRMDGKLKLLLYTVGIWASYFCYFYITFFAFSFTKDLGFMAGLVAFALSSVSMGVPSNGGIGPWHMAVVAALGLYGITQLQATAFATGVFALQSLWIILLGLFGIVMLAIKGKTKEAENPS